MRLKLLALVLLLPLVLAGSVLSSQTIPPEPFTVGTARVDITPPPGFPTGGHGAGGTLARGYWHHLYARAFYLESKDHSPVMLVSTDLFAMPWGLRAKVWIEVQKKFKKEKIKSLLEPQDLTIAATHTHHSPGNYSPEPAHGTFGSSEPGFSPELFDFLVEQISSAVVQAVKSQQIGGHVLLHFANIEGVGQNQFVMNRSPKTFMLNWDRNGVLKDLGRESDHPVPCLPLAGEPDEGWDEEDCPRLRGVDRRMTILEMQDSSGNTVGALVFFAVHPTVLLHSAPLYSSDFVGIALDELERRYSGTIVGFFNGAEGDITARRVHRDFREVLDRAEQFASAIRTVLLTPGTALASSITSKAQLFHTSNQHDRECVDHRMSGELAKMQVIGAAAPGGAERDRTHLYEPGYRDGIKGRATDRQGPKLSASMFDPLNVPQLLPGIVDLLFGLKYVPVSYAEIGNFAIGALPVEMSTTQALRIRREFEKDNSHFQVLGMANQYASYAATASEYAAQDYMGASTIWGPEEGDFFGCALLRLRDNKMPDEFEIPFDSFLPGLQDSVFSGFGTTHVGNARELPDEGLEEIMLDNHYRFERHLPFVEWTETIGGDVDTEYAAAGERRISVVDERGAIVDDNDGNFVKMFRCIASKREHVWAAYWLKPLWEFPPGPVRFKITLRKGQYEKVVLSQAKAVNLRSNLKPVPFPLEPPDVSKSCKGK